MKQLNRKIFGIIKITFSIHSTGTFKLWDPQTQNEQKP